VSNSPTAVCRQQGLLCSAVSMICCRCCSAMLLQQAALQSQVEEPVATVGRAGHGWLLLGCPEPAVPEVVQDRASGRCCQHSVRAHPFCYAAERCGLLCVAAPI
jgi:hypothetical protein